MSHRLRRPLVIDIDDLCDLHDPFDTLVACREADPAFKATLYAIPRRCSPALLNKYNNERDWLRLGMHGWRHTYGECYSWNPPEAQAKISTGIRMGLTDSFRAPKWLLTPIIYEVCAEYGLPVADHTRYCMDPPPPGSIVYRYDLPDAPYKSMHYHTWDTWGNGIEECKDDLIRFIKRGHTYQWVSEAATTTSSLVQDSTELPLPAERSNEGHIVS